MRGVSHTANQNAQSRADKLNFKCYKRKAIIVMYFNKYNKSSKAPDKKVISTNTYKTQGTERIKS